MVELWKFISLDVFYRANNAMFICLFLFQIFQFLPLFFPIYNLAHVNSYQKITKNSFLNAGQITTFSEIFLHIPKSLVYINMGWNFNRFNRLVKDTQLFTLRDLIILASLFEIEPRKMIDLAFTPLVFILKIVSSIVFRTNNLT